jgi:hypothetical protein
MRLEHGDIRIEKTDDLNWTLFLRHTIKKDTKKSKEGDIRWKPTSYHATLDHALSAACCYVAEREETWSDYLRQLRETWAALKEGAK